MTKPYDPGRRLVYDLAALIDRLEQWVRWALYACVGCFVAGLALEYVQMKVLAMIMEGIVLFCGGCGMGVSHACARLTQITHAAIAKALAGQDETLSNG